ncbi:N-acetyltransferase family protein [Nakamurella sp. GG22]
MASSTVRRATALDAATIAGLQIQVWQQAFSDLLPAEVVLADPTAHAAVWDARLRQGGPVLIAHEGSEPVGFAAVSGEVDDHNLLAPIGEIEVLYVVPRWGRRGHGGRLLAGAAAELRRLRATNATWWIPQTDKASAGFLTSAGWSADGLRRELDTGGEPIFEIRFSGGVDLVAV